MTVESLIKNLELLPHPEGGYYKETYRSNTEFTTPFGARSASTGIYYLLENEDFSAFHRIKSDEMWHFYSGSPLEVHHINENGEYGIELLGIELTKGQKPQLVIPAGSWFGSRVQSGQGHSLVGCTVAPGFDFNDFEMADRQELLNAYPQHSEIIHSLTR